MRAPSGNDRMLIYQLSAWFAATFTRKIKHEKGRTGEFSVSKKIEITPFLSCSCVILRAEDVGM
jgi:hypothetical protein